jgi:hypothetical protein
MPTPPHFESLSAFRLFELVLSSEGSAAVRYRLRGQTQEDNGVVQSVGLRERGEASL